MFSLTKGICGGLLAMLALTACEDYTEHNFGTREELYQATQVNNHEITLAASDYATVAKNTTNQAMALAAAADSSIYRELLSVAEKGAFTANISPEEYLPAVLPSLLGSNAYYAMTAGSSIKITYNQEVPVSISGDAYVPYTGAIKAGKYLLVPQGTDQVLTTSGEGKTYGYIYLSGSTQTPDAVTRLTDSAIQLDDISTGWLYSIEKDGSDWLLCNPYGLYLYMKGTYNNFNYIEDLGEIEDEQWPDWSITYNGDGTYDIVNTGAGKTLLFGTQYSSAGAYADKKGTDGYLGIQLYTKGTVNLMSTEIEVQDVTFTLDEDGWSAKGDYLNQTLLGWASTNMDDVYTMLGWSVEYEGGIGDLSYVFRADASYGLRASAYVSGKSTAVNAMAISPQMNFKKAKNPVLTFEQAQKYGGTPLSDYLKVFVSTDFAGRGTRSASTWTEVTDQVQGTWPDGSSWDYSPMSLDLSAYAGQTNVVVGFCYISTEDKVDSEGNVTEKGVAATWEIKNVRCAEPEE